MGYYRYCGISIHALLAESDALKTIKALFDTISIHALLAESDVYGFRLMTAVFLFLSTLSLRRATLILISLL